MNFLSNELGEAEPVSQHTNRPPGSNPNKDFAQRRKANRPKVKNSPVSREPKSDSFRWIDPLPVVEPAPAALETNFETVPCGYIEERFELPSSIAEPFCSTLSTVLDRTHLPTEVIEEVRDKLEAVCYYKAARQLYSTLSDPDKSELQPLKAVFYDSTEIPIHMGSALSMIGNLDTKLGVVEVRDAPLLFKRWILAGLSVDPDVPNCDLDTIHPKHFVWRDRSSKKHIDRRAKEWLENYRLTEAFNVTLDDDSMISVGIPPIPISDAGFNSIPDAYPQADTIRDLVALQQMSTSDFTASRAVPHGRDLTECLQHLGLTLATNDYTIPKIREYFEDAMREYLVKRKVHIESVFRVGPAPTTGTGFAAQLVQSEGNVGRFSLPLGDGDKSLGYMFNPSVSVEIQPRFIMYGRRRHDEEAARFATADVKTVGSD